MTHPSPPKRSRWRPRFSLLTLLLAALLCGSGMLLWKNRAPWAILTTIKESGVVNHARFSPLGTYCYVDTLTGAETTSFDKSTKAATHIYDSNTGRLHLTLPDMAVAEKAAVGVLVSPNDGYAYRFGDLSSDVFTTEIWRLDTGEPVHFKNLQANQLTMPKFSPKDNFAVMGPWDENFLVQVPSLEIVRRLPDMRAREFSPDEKWLAYVNKEPVAELVLISTTIGLPDKHFPVPNIGEFAFSPDGGTVAIGSGGDYDPQKTSLFDVKSERCIGEFEGRHPWVPFSDDGRYLVTLSESSSGVGTAIVWEISSKRECFRFESRANVSISGNRIFNREPAELYDLQSHAKLWTGTGSNAAMTADGAYIVCNPEILEDEEKFNASLHGQQLVDAKTGRTVHTFQLDEGDPIVKDFRWTFNSQQRLMLSYYGTRDIFSQTDPRYHSLQLWHHRRPEEWWGLMWLWEFWLVVVLGVGFVWSVFRAGGMKTLK